MLLFSIMKPLFMAPDLISHVAIPDGIFGTDCMTVLTATTVLIDLTVLAALTSFSSLTALIALGSLTLLTALAALTSFSSLTA